MNIAPVIKRKDTKIAALKKGVLLTVDVNPEDVGSLVGKQGRNISSVRHLVRMIGLKNKSFVSVKLNQPEK